MQVLRDEVVEAGERRSCKERKIKLTIEKNLHAVVSSLF